MFKFRSLLPVLAALLVWQCSPFTEKPVADSFKILTNEPGVYKVRYEDLAAQGLASEPRPSTGLGLTNLGNQVPIWVEDGGDGSFGPGDWFEFRAEILNGQFGYYHEHSNHNVFILDTQAVSARRALAVASSQPVPQLDPDQIQAARNYRASLRMEVDTLLMRFRSSGYEEHEIWYWHKLACTDPEPFTQNFQLDDLRKEEGDTFALTIALRGFSSISDKGDLMPPDHLLGISVNGTDLAMQNWEGTLEHTIRMTDLPVTLLENGDNQIALKIPRRKRGTPEELIIDVTILNWIKIDYPRLDQVNNSRQDRLELANQSPQWHVRTLAGMAPGTHLYGSQGSRVALNENAGYQGFTPAAEEESFVAAAPDTLIQPAAILPYATIDLKDSNRQADYIMIVHPSLRESITPLAEFHQRQGLKVEIVEIQDIYNNFNHGILDPTAIRDFLDYAYHHWQEPRLEYVLLVGDASWDTKHTEVAEDNYPDMAYLARPVTWFSKIPASAYESGHMNNRNLIPTHHFMNNTGHSASDNWFACVEGDDFQPDFAIGRFPVTAPEEVRAIVDKTIRYAQQKDLGPWRKNVLWITNEEERFQMRTDREADKAVEKGFRSTRIFPSSKERSNEGHSRRILESLNEGQFLVNFFGHGGRFIWRTGPPDLKKNHDLFTLDQLDQLKENSRLPVILSLTCYSAPFDHPGSDSIGEKFLRIPKRGAVAFIGASWRNSPSLMMSEYFMRSIADGRTLGQAFVNSKRGIRSRVLVETYNLLGDPALPLNTPAHNVSLEYQYKPVLKQRVVRGKIDDPDFSGKVILEYIDHQGHLVRSFKFKTQSPEFEYVIPKSAEPLPRPEFIHAYVWNPKLGKEGMGSLKVVPPPKPVSIEPEAAVSEGTTASTTASTP